MSNNNTETGNWLSDSLMLFITIAFFYALFLGTRALAITDEQRYAEIGREMALTGHYLIPHVNYIKYFEKPDLFYWLQAFSIKILGANEWAARFWTATFGVLGAVVIYLGTRKLFDRTTGWLAATIVATSLLYYCMAHINTLDMAVCFFITCSLLSFIVATTLPLGKKRRMLIYLSAIAAALGVLTKGLIGIVFPIMIVGVWILLRNDWRLLKQIYLPTALLLFFIVALPWHLLMAHADPHWFHFYFIEQQILRYSTDYAQRYQPFWFFIPVLLIGFFPWTFFLPQAVLTVWRDKHSSERRAIHHFLLLWIGLIFIFFSVSQSKLIGYIVPLFPALAIITAYYLRQMLTLTSYSKGVHYGWLGITLFSIAFAIGLPVAIVIAPMPGKQAIWPFALLLAAVIAASAIISLFLLYRKTLRHALIVLIIGFAAALPLANVVAGYFDDRSIKPMAMIIKPLLKNDTQVISYRHYYQDLPFYLGQRVIIVDWLGELSFGITHQKQQPSWIWNYHQFIVRWNQGTTQRFAIMRRDEYQTLKRQQPQLQLYPIRHNRRDILVSNRRIPL